MARLRTAQVLAIGVLFAFGCSERSTGPRVIELPGEHASLRLELTMASATVQVGDSATATMRLINDSPTAVQLGFGSTCQIMPYIETEAGAVTYPGGGGWGCATVLTTLHVPARGVVIRTLVIRATSQPDNFAGASLPPGRYRAYAVLEPNSGRPSQRSQSVVFEVR